MSEALMHSAMSAASHHDDAARPSPRSRSGMAIWRSDSWLPIGAEKLSHPERSSAGVDDHGQRVVVFSGLCAWLQPRELAIGAALEHQVGSVAVGAFVEVGAESAEAVVSLDGIASPCRGGGNWASRCSISTSGPDGFLLGVACQSMASPPFNELQSAQRTLADHLQSASSATGPATSDHLVYAEIVPRYVVELLRSNSRLNNILEQRPRSGCLNPLYAWHIIEPGLPGGCSTFAFRS